MAFLVLWSQSANQKKIPSEKKTFRKGKFSDLSFVLADLTTYHNSSLFNVPKLQQAETTQFELLQNFDMINVNLFVFLLRQFKLCGFIRWMFFSASSTFKLFNLHQKVKNCLIRSTRKVHKKDIISRPSVK